MPNEEKPAKPVYELVQPADLIKSFRNGHLNDYLSALITVQTLRRQKPDEIFQERTVQIQSGQMMKQKQTVKEVLPIFEHRVHVNLENLKTIDALLAEYGVDLKPFAFKEHK